MTSDYITAADALEISNNDSVIDNIMVEIRKDVYSVSWDGNNN